MSTRPKRRLLLLLAAAAVLSQGAAHCKPAPEDTITQYEGGGVIVYNGAVAPSGNPADDLAISSTADGSVIPQSEGIALAQRCFTHWAWGKGMSQYFYALAKFDLVISYCVENGAFTRQPYLRSAAMDGYGPWEPEYGNGAYGMQVFSRRPYGSQDSVITSGIAKFCLPSYIGLCQHLQIDIITDPDDPYAVMGGVHGWGVFHD